MLVDEQVGFDQLALERTIRSLSRVGIRKAPLTLDRVKAWVKQFDSGAERTLAWLMLRSLVFRTSEQLEAVLRQAVKSAVNHFTDQVGLEKSPDWRSAIARKEGGLTFYCGPPTLENSSSPGKSGDVITRLVNRSFAVEKWYPGNIGTLAIDERYLIVDDALYTGIQLEGFLQQWGQPYSEGRIAAVVGIAHEAGIEYIKQRFPKLHVFSGESLKAEHCFSYQCQEWIKNGQWKHDVGPRETYAQVCERYGFQDTAEGFGSLGVMVAFEHGIADDALALFWQSSEQWKPLVER